MNTDVKALLTSGVTLTDAALERLLPAATTEPHSIHRAMRHSTFAGGKRLRPILCMEAARMVAGALPDGAAVLGSDELGAAIEMLHTYSLIHDDLPALDNDDLRRGKPTCHVAFGEATAILAGDALQTLAFQTIAQLPAPAATTVAILREVAIAVGTGVGADLPGSLPPGMIGGQVMDIEGGGTKPTAELVERIHRAKTGALITVSIVAGGLLGLGYCLARGEDIRPGPNYGLDIIARLRTFGEKAGLAFQIVDDILDMTQTSEELGKTAGKDTATDKATWPAVFGIEQSKHDAAELIADAFAALGPFGDAATPLKSLAQYLVDRTH
ncbi:MAG TPA: farnesyl diphosphate synthase [Acidobacteriaceae bacterium]|nr:farnesyl diphosphate synthase [Acidobacteriaceae bacterium]